MNEKTGAKVLIVDDERSNIIALNHILKPIYTTFAAISGKAALEIAREVVPDLILLDIIMPDISGFEVLTELKRSDTLRRVPVIFITGLDSIKDEEKGFALGAADYITKPFHSAIVKARVKMHLQVVEYIRTIEQLSRIDVLTDVLNRRGFDERMSAEWSSALRDSDLLSILMIDIDRFKDYNDTHGHLQGDIALQMVAGKLKAASKRETDFAARWGGEEFIVLLPGTDADGALAVAEGIRADIGAEILSETNASVTVSIGANTAVPSAQGTVDGFIHGADEALYEAKRGGRNRVCHRREFN